MKLNFDLIKKHPIPVIGVIVVGALIVYLLLTRGGGGSSGQTVVNGSSGPSDAQVAAATSLQLAQIGAGVQTQGIQGQILMQGADIAGQLELAKVGVGASIAQMTAQLQATLRGYDSADLQTTSNRDVQISGIAATLQGQRDQLQVTYDLARLSADSNAHMIDSQVTLNAQNNLTQMTLSAMNLDFQKDFLNAQVASNDRANSLALFSNIATTKPVWFRDNSAQLLALLH